jgi:hypothetical protein
LLQNRRIAYFILTCAMSLLTGYARAGDQLIRNFDRGPGLNAVGVIEASPGAGGPAANEVGDREEIEGPQAIHSGDHGEIFILDQVNGRVLLLDPKRPAEQTRSLELPEGSRPTDLVVLNESIYVWDGEPRALQAKGPDDGPVRSLSFTQNMVHPAEAVTSAFAQTGSEALAPEVDANAITRGIGGDKTRSHSHQLVASHGKGQVSKIREEFFRPANLRKASEGKFRDKDYGFHCELGGHPVPTGQCYSRTTHRRLNCCYPICSDTRGVVAICVGIDFGAISSVTRLPDHAARSMI